MHRIRVYADTSVFGGVYDDQFAKASRRFFEYVRQGKYIVLVSRLTTDELEVAPTEVLRIMRDLSPSQVEPVRLDTEVMDLAREYVKAGVLGEASMDDAIHVAAASIAGADLILSWNFKHIVNYNRICGFNSVNIRSGCRSMVILSPTEVADYDQD